MFFVISLQHNVEVAVYLVEKTDKGCDFCMVLWVMLMNMKNT